MKVALLFMGQPRFIESLESYKSHYNNIISKYDTDVFCHAWWSNNEVEYEASDWSRILNNKCKVSNNAINIICNVYKPVSFKYEKSKNFFHNNYTQQKIQHLFNHIITSSIKSQNNALSHLYSIKQVGNLLKEHINLTNTHYDFIILSRYDSILTDFPDLNMLNSDYFYSSNLHPHFPDLIYVFGSKYINFTNVYDNIDNIISNYSHQKEFWEPSNECYKYFHFILNFDNNLNKLINMNVALIRK